MAFSKGWLGGPKFILVARGSDTGRHGGAHSGGVPAQKFRFLATLARAQALAAKQRWQNRPSKEGAKT